MTADVHLLADETRTSVAAVCRALELPRSSVYARRNRPPSRRAQDTALLDVEVTAAHEGSERRYGSPRVHRALRRQGRRVSRKRVEARMRALGLRSKRTKRFRRTTQADTAHVPSPNLLNRQFARATPHEAWAGDITFIWTEQGWVYLALLIDLCTRSIVGWAVSEHCDAELALRCLNKAVAQHRPGAGLLHHTDRGSTYTAAAYRTRLRELGMIQSMSRRGNCWDNGVPRTLERRCFTGDERTVSRNLVAGLGFKLRRAAVVKSHGGERRRKGVGRGVKYEMARRTQVNC